MPGVVAVDVETPGTAYFDEPFCATLTWRGADGSLQNMYIALADEFGGADPATLEERVSLLHGLLMWVPVWVFHNAKFDLQKLALLGALPSLEGITIEDTAPLYGLLDENSSKKLKDLAVRVLRYDDTIQVAYKSGKKKGQTRPVAREKHILDTVRRKLGLKVADGYYYIPREVIVPYALRDTDFTLQLFEVLKPKLEGKDDPALTAMYEQEIELVRVFLRLEGNGIEVDVPALEAMASEFGTRLMELMLELRAIAPDVDPESHEQVLPYLQSRGHKIENTQKATLKQLDDDYAQKLLEYRKTKKTHTTYLVGLLREQRDGVIHPWFNITGARTGRMSSGSAHE